MTPEEAAERLKAIAILVWWAHARAAVFVREPDPMDGVTITPAPMNKLKVCCPNCGPRWLAEMFQRMQSWGSGLSWAGTGWMNRRYKLEEKPGIEAVAWAFGVMQAWLPEKWPEPIHHYRVEVPVLHTSLETGVGDEATVRAELEAKVRQGSVFCYRAGDVDWNTAKVVYLGREVYGPEYMDVPEVPSSSG